ncbi:hypothetical protein [Rhodococcus globerulus]|uniref:hypothetical protein n=1 Tax=Rhodococcus globerulus TaxID=33008 RepID=UPI000B066222|nr:hypothetical protein [Rhodococcus globerulus]
MIFTECDEMQAEFGMPPHRSNERCKWCVDAYAEEFDGPKYTATERRNVLRLWGERSRVVQDALLVDFGDVIIERSIALLEELPPDLQQSVLLEAYPVDPDEHSSAFEVEGKRMRAVEKRDPRNMLPPAYLRYLRYFFRNHGRLPAVVVLNFTERVVRECGIPSRLLMPPEMRADLTRRFTLELEPEFF